MKDGLGRKLGDLIGSSRGRSGTGTRGGEIKANQGWFYHASLFTPRGKISVLLTLAGVRGTGGDAYAT